MEIPIIACDVSKGRSHVRGFVGLANPFGPAFVVRHVKSDLRKLKELAKSLESSARRKPVFVFEYTGVYHEPIARYAESIGLELRAISPLESAKVRKSAIRPTKTDALDCVNIATVFYKRGLMPYPGHGGDAKALSRRKKAITARLVYEKIDYRRLLDLVWPCFDEVFAHADLPLPMAVVASFGHPSALRKRSSKQIADVLEHRRGTPHKTALRIADKLKAYAADCVSGVPEGSEHIATIRSTIDRIVGLEKEMETTNGKLARILAKSPAFPLVKSIPGCGENLSLVITAELGDTSRFRSAKQLVAYCGLDPMIIQSGRSDGEHFSITRKGNGRLRSALFLLVGFMIRMKLENQITSFYKAKRNGSLSHKGAVVAASRKLACCIYGMLKTGVCFEAK